MAAAGTLLIESIIMMQVWIVGREHYLTEAGQRFYPIVIGYLVRISIIE